MALIHTDCIYLDTFVLLRCVGAWAENYSDIKDGIILARKDRQTETLFV